MQINYDTKSDTKYIRLKKGEVSRTQKLEDWLLVDLDANDDALGVEILDASLHPVGISTVWGQLFDISSVEYKPVGRGEDKSAQMETKLTSQQRTFTNAS